MSGAADVKPRDYEPGAEVEASTPYAAFFAMKESGPALEPGDMLESATGDLRIFKYVGFEEARWVLPEAKSTEQKAEEAQSPVPTEA